MILCLQTYEIALQYSVNPAWYLKLTVSCTVNSSTTLRKNDKIEIIVWIIKNASSKSSSHQRLILDNGIIFFCPIFFWTSEMIFSPQIFILSSKNVH